MRHFMNVVRDPPDIDGAFGSFRGQSRDEREIVENARFDRPDEGCESPAEAPDRDRRRRMRREILDDFGETPFDGLLALARRSGSRVPAEQLKHQFSL